MQPLVMPMYSLCIRPPVEPIGPKLVQRMVIMLNISMVKSIGQVVPMEERDPTLTHLIVIPGLTLTKFMLHTMLLKHVEQQADLLYLVQDTSRSDILIVHR